MPITIHSSLSNVNLNPLNGLKGLCAIIILCGHFVTNFAPKAPEQYGLIAIEYFSAVTLFFILSGFTLSLFYQKASQKLEFWIKRMARIAPMYWFSLLVAIPSLIAYSQSIAISATLTTLFLQSITLVGNDFNNSLWQISAFVVCYLIYPFVIERISSMVKTVNSEERNDANTVRVQPTAWFWITASLLYFLPLIVLIIAYTLLDFGLGLVHIWVGFRAPHFFLGVLLGCLFKKPAEKTSGLLETEYTELNSEPSKSNSEIDLKHARKTYRRHVWLTEVGSLVLLLLSLACPVLVRFLGIGVWFPYQIWLEYIIAPLHAWWVFQLVQKPIPSITGESETQVSMSDGPTRFFFSSRIMQYIGERSYAIYCLHYPLLYIYSWIKIGGISALQQRDRKVEMAPNKTTTDGPFVLDFYDIIPVLAVVWTISELAYHFVETPARNGIVKLLTKEKLKQ